MATHLFIVEFSCEFHAHHGPNKWQQTFRQITVVTEQPEWQTLAILESGLKQQKITLVSTFLPNLLKHYSCRRLISIGASVSEKDEIFSIMHLFGCLYQILDLCVPACPTPSDPEQCSAVVFPRVITSLPYQHLDICISSGRWHYSLFCRSCGLC